MRGDRSIPRGEAGRVALRVRELLGDDDDDSSEEDLSDDDLSDDDFPGLDNGVGNGPDGGFFEEFGGIGPHAPVLGSSPTRWERLHARVPVRIDPGRRAAWGVGAAVVLAAVITGLWLMSSRPAAVPVAARVPQVPGSSLVGTAGAGSSAGSGSSSGSGSAGRSSVSTAPGVVSTGSPASAAAGLVVVDVAGKVVRPGLYRLPTGSRVDDAIRAAGGPRHGVDLTSLNLAATLADGQQILVGVPGAGVQGPTAPGGAGSGSGGAAAAGTASSSGPVNLNTASLEQLDALPGIGPALAQRTLDWRSAHGQFTGVDQLNDVSGIGDVKFAELKDLVTV